MIAPCHIPLTLRHTYERTVAATGCVYHSWAIWLAYRSRIIGEVVAAGEVGDWDWGYEPIKKAA